MPGGLKSGFLTKKAVHGHGQWQRRFFILSTGSLSYYKDATHTHANPKTFPIGTESIIKDSQIQGKEFAFQLESPKVDTLHLVADSEEEMQQWKTAVQTAINDLQSLERGLTPMSPSTTSAAEDSKTRGILVQIIAAAEKRMDDDDYYEAKFDNQHELGLTLRRAEDWAIVHVSEVASVTQGSVLAKVHSDSVMLHSYDDVMMKLKAAEWPLSMGFLRAINKKGTLDRQHRAAGRKVWKPKWFELSEGCLNYYDVEGGEIRGCYQLGDCQLSPCVVEGQSHCLLLTHNKGAGSATSTSDNGKTGPLLVKARTHDELVDWGSAIYHTIVAQSGGGYIKVAAAQREAAEADSALESMKNELAAADADADAGAGANNEKEEDAVAPVDTVTDASGGAAGAKLHLARQKSDQAHLTLEKAASSHSRKQSMGLSLAVDASRIASGQDEDGKEGAGSSEQRIADNMQKFFSAKGGDDAMEDPIEDFSRKFSTKVGHRKVGGEGDGSGSGSGSGSAGGGGDAGSQGEKGADAGAGAGAGAGTDTGTGQSKKRPSLNSHGDAAREVIAAGEGEGQGQGGAAARAAGCGGEGEESPKRKGSGSNIARKMSGFLGFGNNKAVADTAGAAGAAAGITTSTGTTAGVAAGAEGAGVAADNNSRTSFSSGADSLSLTELKKNLEAAGVDYSTFLEKSEFVTALELELASSRVRARSATRDAAAAAVAPAASAASAAASGDGDGVAKGDTLRTTITTTTTTTTTTTGTGGTAVIVNGVEMDEEQLAKLHKSAATKFNMKPKNGIKFLQESGVMPRDDPAAVAEYLHTHMNRLSKRKIGEYIGNIGEFNQLVLAVYVTLFEFTSEMLVDDAMRLFMQAFRLPGEAQQIDRILERFAQAYAAKVPGMFKNSDVAYVLAFSIIMLNTDLHNRNLQPNKRMTLEQFKRNCAGINDGEDMPEEILETLYKRIQDNEIKMSDGDMYESEVVTFMAPTRSGWLSKQGAGSRLAKAKWNKHWFLVSDSCLYYFLNQQDDDPRCIIPLENCSVRKVPNNSRQFCIYSTEEKGLVKSVKVMDNGAMKQGAHTEFKLRAETPEERDQWIQSIEGELSKDNFHEMLQNKKNKVQERAAGEAHRDKPVVEGWMYKKGAVNTSWKKRYCTIQSSPPARLYYFDDEKKAAQMKENGTNSAKGSLELTAVVSVSLIEDKTAPKMVNQCIEIRTVKPSRVWSFAPMDVTVNQEWVERIKVVSNLVEGERTGRGSDAGAGAGSGAGSDAGGSPAATATASVTAAATAKAAGEKHGSTIARAVSVDADSNSF